MTCADWPIDGACLSDAWATLDVAIRERAIALASATLRRLTGYRVGGCPVIVRPCKPPNFGMDYYGYSAALYRPFVNGSGAWVNSCACSSPCGCTSVCQVSLPAPVGQIYEVKVDGSVVSQGNYRLDGNLLVYTGTGDCPWPATQNLSRPDTEAGTFSVTYLNSYPVDAAGSYAAAVLAEEFAQACLGNSCRLPSGVTTIIRQGITMEVTSGVFPNGMTGIREVDTYIALWNPGGLRQQSTVWSPDLRAPRTTGVTPTGISTPPDEDIDVTISEDPDDPGTYLIGVTS